MAITDIQISEELQTNAPSIKYSGNEGPKSPQQEMQKMRMAQLEEEYSRYVEDMIEQGLEPMSLEQFMQQAMAEGRMASNPSLEDSRNEMMENIALDEFGKPLKDLSEDEIIQIEDMMDNMSGGNPLPNDPTKPVNPWTPKPQGPALPDRQMAAFGGIMSLDGRRKYGLGSRLRKLIPNELAKVAEVAAPFVAMAAPQFALPAALAGGLGSYDRTGNLMSGLKSGALTYGLGTLSPGMERFKNVSATNPFTGNKFTQPFGGRFNVSNLFKSKAPANIEAISGSDYGQFNEPVFGADDALGGEYLTTGSKIAKTAEDTKSTTGILKTMKDLMLDNKLLTGLAAGTLGMTALMGNMEPEEIQDMQRGEGLDIAGIRAEVIEAYKDPTGAKLKALASKYPFLSKREDIDVEKLAYGGRIGRAEGGLMDLGGMEKDYRAEGGFVPIGAKEKADDVPARLSVNEFVFTADAVRNAGGGDIDKGAEVMENMMKNLEQGGQVSEESQGMQGAQQMFETSERLSEVI